MNGISIFFLKCKKGYNEANFTSFYVKITVTLKERSRREKPKSRSVFYSTLICM